MKNKVSSKETPPRVFTSDKASSPLEYDKHFPPIKGSVKVMRLTLGGVSVPIPEFPQVVSLKEREEVISKQIEELVAQRKELRNEKNSKKTDESPLPQRQPRKTLPKIISNVQVAPPREGSSGRLGSEAQPIPGSDKWTEIQTRRSKKNKTEGGNTDNSQSKTREKPQKTKPSLRVQQDSKEDKKSKKKTPKKRRPPKTAAVALKSLTEGLTYAQIITQIDRRCAYRILVYPKLRLGMP